MLVNNENRFQFLYFLLSGLVAITILVLFYVSMKTTIKEQFKDDLKMIQKSMNFNRPMSTWDYKNTWKTIGNAALRHMIYSAYFDPRTDLIDDLQVNGQEIPIGSLRIFALLPLNFSDDIRCIIRRDDFSTKEIPAGDVLRVHQHHSELYGVFSIMCPFYVPRNISVVNLPDAVAIAYASNRLSHMSPTFVQISYAKNMEHMLAKSRPVLSVCVGPLQFNYSNVLRIAEFVELYRILGARYFYFYKMEATDDVMRLLTHYRNIGIADVLDWNLLNYTDVHYGGIMAQINDCVFRANTVDNFRYAAIVDLDEVLIPLKHNSLADYLRHCDEGRTSAFMFRNVFFYQKGPNDTFSLPAHTRNRMLYSQTKVRRAVEIKPAYERSKCIVNTRAIIEMGNHQIWKALPAYTEAVVHHTVGLLFHYRDKCLNCKEVLMVDYTARRFGSLLWDRVDEVCLKLFMPMKGICPLS